ncbi:hypothetical protein [Ottowia sp.]|jgi:hypothetical protein|uniref:hypothetical protein n=1 Tax=Ottowia sp. TaxID=1898956 RepID=UPI0025D7DCC5|nr:hypothetical protein [Ottowia sp.]MBK6613359.1 hypothetical protein [Ottowia sp.]MBK6747534.1 hypothetical protein [Ottowia sp.]
MNAMTWLAPLSSWLVMLHLGAQAYVQHDAPSSRPGVAFYLAHYGAPLAVVFLLGHAGVIGSHESLGLAVCVLSGVGTSAVPWALRDGASAGAMTRRLALGATVALIALPLASLAYADRDHALIRFAVTASILVGVLWLPWRLGRLLLRHAWLPKPGLAVLGTAATLSVIALILLVAWHELPRLPERPWLIAACFLLVTTQGVGGALLDARTGLATTAVIRNLTLATLVLVIDERTANAVTALAAFGTLMYLGVWPTSRLARLLGAPRPSTATAEQDTR